jgi:hypothetical protein
MRPSASVSEPRLGLPKKQPTTARRQESTDAVPRLAGDGIRLSAASRGRFGFVRVKLHPRKPISPAQGHGAQL